MKKSLALIGLFGTSNDALELEVKECLAYYAYLISVTVKVFKLVLLRWIPSNQTELLMGFANQRLTFKDYIRSSLS